MGVEGMATRTRAGTAANGGVGGGRERARPPVVGMVGAGQLARMTGQAAIGLGIEFRVLADAAGDSAAQVCAGTHVGDYRSARDVLAFGAGCDVVTFDHEHVPGEHLAALAGVASVHPSPSALVFAQDKGTMRDRLSAQGLLAELGARCPAYRRVASVDDVIAFAADSASERGFRGVAPPGQHRGGIRGVAPPGQHRAGWPVVLKATSGGYDGKGVWVCDAPDEAAEVISHGIGLIAEEYVRFDAELAVLVARSPAGQGAAYPAVQTVQRDGVCREVIAPAPGLDGELATRAQRLGLALAAELGVTGLLAVELFLVRGEPDELIVNELAMRPHNCGHWTIDAARTSQFEQHLRAVLDLPLGSPDLTAPTAVMVNVLGDGAVPGGRTSGSHGGNADLHARLAHVMAADPGVKVHLYGKQVRPGRKVGHVTAVGRDVGQARERAWRAASYLSLGRETADWGGGGSGW